jgi:putative molybdopterin biosynthesis protein
LLDEETGTYNVAYIQRLLPDLPVVLLNLVYRQQGLIVPPGNPKKIQKLEDLTRPDVCFSNRQRGSGTRVLLDYLLSKEQIKAGTIRGYEREEFTHMAVAAAVATGTADAGLGILSAARALKLDFIPVTEERYDLCIPLAFWDTPPLVTLATAVKSTEFKEAVMSLGGYLLRDSGRILYGLD